MPVSAPAPPPAATPQPPAVPTQEQVTTFRTFMFPRPLVFPQKSRHIPLNCTLNHYTREYDLRPPVRIYTYPYTNIKHQHITKVLTYTDSRSTRAATSIHTHRWLRWCQSSLQTVLSCRLCDKRHARVPFWLYHQSLSCLRSRVLLYIFCLYTILFLHMDRVQNRWW